MSLVPTLFIGHGSPTVALEPTPAHHFLRSLGARLGRPRAILCISAHWETGVPTVTAAERPDTIHDFRGFPDTFYELRYPAPGDPRLAARIVERLAEAGFEARTDPARGLDHGAWIPLLLMYPEADVPVLQLSVQPASGTGHHLALGAALAPLREDGILVLGSGALTHNLADASGRLRAGATATGEAPPDWAVTFDRWVTDRVERGDLAALAAYRERAPFAATAHPTEEHLLPLHVAAAAGGGCGRKVHESFEFGSIGMGVFAFPDLA